MSSFPFSASMLAQKAYSHPTVTPSTDDLLDIYVDWNGDAITCSARGKSVVRDADGRAVRETVAKAVMRLTEWNEKAESVITIQVVGFKRLKPAKPPMGALSID